MRINEPPRAYVYLPFLQAYRSSMVLYMRGSAPVDALVAQARAHVQALDADLPILNARPLAEQLKGALLLFNLAATMLFIFGVAGMALAAMGTYGLVSYTVKQSTHEIGIRMALGAPRPVGRARFLGRGLRLGAIGAALGTVAAQSAPPGCLSGVLFGVSADRPHLIRASAGARPRRRDRRDDRASLARRADQSVERAAPSMSLRPWTCTSSTARTSCSDTTMRFRPRETGTGARSERFAACWPRSSA